MPRQRQYRENTWSKIEQQERHDFISKNTITNDDQRCTAKRDILRESSKIFDPMGMLSPVTDRAKSLLMQKLWTQKFEWDQALSEEIKAEWSDIVQDLHKVVPTELPRCYFSDITERTGKDYTLHVFTDSSEKAYGACAYIFGPNQAMLVMSKKRIAPAKKITLPKLELMGTLVGVRLANHIIKNLGKINLVR